MRKLALRFVGRRMKVEVASDREPLDVVISAATSEGTATDGELEKRAFAMEQAFNELTQGRLHVSIEEDNDAQ